MMVLECHLFNPRLSKFSASTMPNPSPAKPEPNIVRAWTFQETLLEFYRYTPQQPEKLPAHSHDEYQLCLSVNYPSEYWYRKTTHFVPIGSLSIIHPGEMHSGTGRDMGNYWVPATFRMMYVTPTLFHQVAEDLLQPSNNAPFFTDSIILDPVLANQFLKFHRASYGMASQLEQEEQLQSFLTTLVQTYSDSPLRIRPIRQEREAVQRVRDYLQDNYATNTSLRQLAQIVNLSPYYLSRVFKAEVGVSLPQYQTQVRVNHAKALLVQGMPIKQVARKTGFVDQSHLTHHFKRFVHTTPGSYGWKECKNLQNFLS
jgi:AraC-like DNA-binding protein